MSQASPSTDTAPLPHPALNGPLEGAVRLEDWGVIAAQGEESAKFLHSQLTQDLALQTPQQARLAGYCSPKGRLLATMVAFKPAADAVLLALPAELLPQTQKRLSMFVMRAKCKLADASASQAGGWAVWGLAGHAAQQWLGADGSEAPWSAFGKALPDGRQAWGTRLPQAGTQGGTVARYLLLVPADAAAPTLPTISPSDWAALDIASGLAWVRSATVEQFVPQMLNLELLGGVSFQKGCYPGQEIVARSQYRGTIKRRTFAFAVETAAQVGQEVFHSEDPEQPAGLVASVAAQGAGSLLLVETKLAALQSGSLHLGSAQGPALTQQALPYVIAEPQ
ncbi:folate-binding protein YgfZ [Mitsuaria sp. WAJ17]|uniref:CAF17-like 4Fe-4S cluster assembly/insertion protein YgfZ n=1 Tax=Mitsuaria sp. WAJ17 TaxID=2761452 RepID=UPI001602FAC8|nr:folate-binding protein YgfZ [Mitsuaria sp. WAJ17]MBB2486370.1 folate-binding protein YgfZ [Mitsuaria sp. WAJ17]